MRVSSGHVAKERSSAREGAVNHAFRRQKKTMWMMREENFGKAMKWHDSWIAFFGIFLVLLVLKMPQFLNRVISYKKLLGFLGPGDFWG